MPNPNNTMVKCAVSGKEMRIQDAYAAANLRHQLFELIQSENPEVTRKSYLTPECVNDYREKYMLNAIKEEYGEVSQLQTEVVQAIKQSTLLSKNTGAEERPGKSTFGEKLSDKIAEFGGSWTFILSFFGFMFLWIALNIFLLQNHAYDPYPFILLNLILSCLASIQAPIIMMSQNRQEKKDRFRGEQDYKINLKAELEIKLLHEKLDYMIVHQHHLLLEIQELQTDYLKEIVERLDSKK